MIDTDAPDGAQAAPRAMASSVGALLRKRWGLPAIVAATLTCAAVALFAIILPSYQRPSTGTHMSRLGYPALLRSLGRPLPVETATAEERPIVRSMLAEGTLASDTVQVPMVPAGRIIGVYVQPGQRVHKGELLAELDPRKGKLTADTARLAFEIAKDQLRRVQVGTVVQLNSEQPRKDAIDVGALQRELALLRDEVATKENLFSQGLVSKDAYLAAKRNLEETQRALETSNLNLDVSVMGKSASERMAADAMQQAALAWQETLHDLDEYKVFAPDDGIVDRVLVHAGEYNQTPGLPAVTMDVGLWFEAYFDQTAVDDVTKDATAEVHLAARPESTLVGRVENVNPIVAYATGGPESERPVRPMGTGGPEWPATFQVRIALPLDAIAGLAPGLTGFARISAEHRAVAVPSAAVLSVSSGNGLLSIVDGEGWHLRRARYGATTDGWVEIRDGVAEGERVIVEGQDVLQPGDRIRETARFLPDAGR